MTRRDSVVGLTAAEINRATTRLAHLKDGIIDISQVTRGTTMLLAIQETMHNVPPEVAVLAAYHQGLRIGLQVAADRRIATCR